MIQEYQTKNCKTCIFWERHEQGWPLGTCSNGNPKMATPIGWGDRRLLCNEDFGCILYKKTKQRRGKL